MTDEFVAKWGRYKRLPVRIMERRDLTGNEKMVLGYLVDFEDWMGPAPGVGTIAARVGCSRRGAQKMLRRLERAGWLRAVEGGGGRGRTTRYKVEVPAEREDPEGTCAVSDAQKAEHVDVKSEAGSPFDQEVKGEPCDLKGRTEPRERANAITEYGEGCSPGLDLSLETRSKTASQTAGEAACAHAKPSKRRQAKIGKPKARVMPAEARTPEAEALFRALFGASWADTSRSEGLMARDWAPTIYAIAGRVRGDDQTFVRLVDLAGELRMRAVERKVTSAPAVFRAEAKKIVDERDDGALGVEGQECEVTEGAACDLA